MLFISKLLNKHRFLLTSWLLQHGPVPKNIWWFPEPAPAPYWWENGDEQASYPLRVSCPLRRTLCWISPSGFPLKRLACRPPSPWACTAWKDAQHTAAHPSTSLATVQAPISPRRAAPWVLTLNTHLLWSPGHLRAPLVQSTSTPGWELGVQRGKAINKCRLYIDLTLSYTWLCFSSLRIP